MSNIVPPSYAIERVLNKRGRLNIYESFVPDKTAMLVIDMQSYYIDRVPLMRKIIPTTKYLVDSLRARGCLIVWVLNTLERDGIDLWPAYHERFFSPEEAKLHRIGLASKSEGHALVSGLETDSKDLIIEKTKFSPFAPDSSDLPAELMARSIDNIVIAGVATNVCCESTARDAMMRDFRVVCVDDAMAALTEEDHRCGLASMYSCFADIRKSDDVLENLILK